MIKRISYLLTFAFIAAAAYFGCENPALGGFGTETNMDSSGIITIEILEAAESRSNAPDSADSPIEQFEVLLTGPQSYGPLLFGVREIRIEDLPLGDYTISVSGLDRGMNVVAAGSVSDVSVDGSDSEIVPVELTPVMGGTGTVTGRYDWSAAGFSSDFVDNAAVTMAPTGGSPFPIEVDLEDNSLEFSGEWPSGEYTLSIELYDGETLIAAIEEIVWVFDDTETGAEGVFGPELFYAAPEAPRLTAVRQDGLTVHLEWEDHSDLESGFNIYRSIDDGPFALVGRNLPANTTTWIDEPIDPDTVYNYRISAVNTFGESESGEQVVETQPLIVPPELGDITDQPVTIGNPNNAISLSTLLQGFDNTYNASGLEIVSVGSVDGLNLELDGGLLRIDTSAIPYESEGAEIILDFTVHINGQPLSDAYLSSGQLTLILEAPEVELIEESDLLDPIEAYIYDDRGELSRKMDFYRPPNPEEIFNQWERIINGARYSDMESAEEERRRRGDEADQALDWKLHQDRNRSYVEYPRNSVYAGFVSPDRERYEKFTLEATVSSKDRDDDTVGLIVAYVRDGDENYVLEAARSRGASSGETSVEPSSGWGLVARRLGSDAENPEIGEVLWSKQIDVGSPMNSGWNGLSSRIRVEREGDRVTVLTTDWDELDDFLYSSSLSVNLAEVVELQRFRGPQQYGYFTASQGRTSFGDMSFDGGRIVDQLFYVDPTTGETEVWVYDAEAGRWRQLWETRIQDIIGYPVEITNPETGETFLVERRSTNPGRWRDWWRRQARDLYSGSSR